MTTTSTAQNNPFFKEILLACNRIRAMDGNTIFVSQKPTTYVLEGYTFKMTYKDLELPFWVGRNDKRIFFIAYNKLTKEEAQEKLGSTFNGSIKAGWEVNYEPIELLGKEVNLLAQSERPGVSIICTTVSAESLLGTKEKQEEVDDSLRLKKVEVLTPAGKYWATDIAMMAQSWFRTCERYGVGPIPNMEPAPL